MRAGMACLIDCSLFDFAVVWFGRVLCGGVRYVWMSRKRLAVMFGNSTVSSSTIESLPLLVSTTTLAVQCHDRWFQDVPHCLQQC